jgi:hypothetical protein
VIVVGQVVAEASSGAAIAQSGAAALVFGLMLFFVFRYVAQPWVYVWDRDIGRRVVMAIPGLFVAGGLVAILVGAVKG